MTVPSTTSGRRLDRAARRSQLIASAYALARQVPLDQISAEEVAVEAGVSKALVFHYFPATIDLHVAVLEAAADELRARLDPDERLTPEQRLRTGLTAFADYIEEHQHTYVALVRGSAVHEELLAVFERTREAVVDLLAEGLGATDLALPIRVGLRGWVAMVEEALLHWIRTGRAFDRAHLLAMLYDIGVAIVPRAAGIPTLER